LRNMPGIGIYIGPGGEEFAQAQVEEHRRRHSSPDSESEFSSLAGSV
jgi:hypothetical protein